MRGNWNEALSWAIDSAARLLQPPIQERVQTFCGPLARASADSDSSADDQHYIAELLRMFCDYEPKEAAAILLRSRPQVPHPATCVWAFELTWCQADAGRCSMIRSRMC